MARLEYAPDVSELTFPYIYKKNFMEDLGFDEPFLSEVDTREKIIAMMTAMGTAFAYFILVHASENDAVCRNILVCPRYATLSDVTIDCRFPGIKNFFLVKML